MKCSSTSVHRGASHQMCVSVCGGTERFGVIQVGLKIGGFVHLVFVCVC